MQLQIWTKGGHNQLVTLQHGCSLFLYRAPGLLPSKAEPDEGGLRLVELAPALVAVSAGFYRQQPVAARIAMSLIEDSTELLTVLLNGSHSVVAGRLRVRSGNWDPDDQDKDARDAMAAKGYFEAHTEVCTLIERTLKSSSPGYALHEALGRWYRALFSPGVQAGLNKPSDLAGWRNEQVYIRGAMHVPLSKEAVRDCMPVLFDLIAAEPHPGVRAVLGHFFFVYIHPYMDGNGRLGRFLMNAMLATGGHVWTVVPVEQRKTYMETLEAASAGHDITGFAAFIGQLIREQTHPGPLPLRAGPE